VKKKKIRIFIKIEDVITVKRIKEKARIERKVRRKLVNR
jgi:hypothetical protein